jgi:hypothetical protein
MGREARTAMSRHHSDDMSGDGQSGVGVGGRCNFRAQHAPNTGESGRIKTILAPVRFGFLKRPVFDPYYLSRS